MNETTNIRYTEPTDHDINHPLESAEWVAISRDDSRDTLLMSESYGYYRAHVMHACGKLETLLWSLTQAWALPKDHTVYIWHNSELAGKLVNDVDPSDPAAEKWGLWTDMTAEDKWLSTQMLNAWHELAQRGLAYCAEVKRPWESRCIYTERDANCPEYIQVHITQFGELGDEHGDYAGQAPVVDKYRYSKLLHDYPGLESEEQTILSSSDGTVYSVEYRGDQGGYLNNALDSIRIPAEVRLLDTDIDGVDILGALVIVRKEK